MRWGVEKRLEFIEFRLLWEGGINRADITERFGVSVPQASKDLTLYGEKAPGNLLYDKSAKRYLTSPNFKPIFLEPDSNRYLGELRSISSSTDALHKTWLSFTPDHDAMPVPHREVKVDVLRAVVAAIKNCKAIEIEYQSMNVDRPAPEWRWITPHAFASDGLRWHIRAFCHIDHKFKDFILSRCLKAKGESAPGSLHSDDIFWQSKFNVKLSPNPELSSAQQAIVAQDYRMSHGVVTVPIRKALLYYFQKRLRLDVKNVQDRPHEAPVVVANRAAFDAAIAEATS